MTTSPATYTPSFCEAIRAGCEHKMEVIQEEVTEVKTSVQRIDSRFFTMILLMVGNLVAAVGGLAFYLLTHRETATLIEAVNKSMGVIPK